MTARFPTVSLLGVAALSVTLSGCQTLPDNQPVTDNQKTASGIHLQLHAQANPPEKTGREITLVAADETLHKAIRTAYPDAPISADSGIRLDQRLNVWAENLAPARYLDYLGSQVDASIRYTSRDEVEVRSVANWEFTLPKSSAGELMPQAVQIAHQAGLKALVLGDAKHILLLSGKPGDLDQVRRALGQVSDRITLERTMHADGEAL